jgi:hypothetical protein
MNFFEILLSKRKRPIGKAKENKHTHTHSPNTYYNIIILSNLHIYIYI